jgi:hypothetical protein
MPAIPCAEPATDHRPGKERRQGGRGRGNRESGCSSQREAQQHDVARHVGYEHVPENQVAERVNQSRDQRHREQYRRQRAMPAPEVRHDRVADIGDKSTHQTTPQDGPSGLLDKRRPIPPIMSNDLF